jgi:hypothetical protein
LLHDLQSRMAGFEVEAVEADLLGFRRYIQGKARLILCMGDTLPHLESLDAVACLLGEVAASLEAGGSFITSFRDYSTALTATRRFIPVRSDADRILTCFLEYADERVTVHDILHERVDQQWKLQVSSYRKLRLSADWLVHGLQSHGLSVRREAGLGGMIRIVAQRD